MPQRIAAFYKDVEWQRMHVEDACQRAEREISTKVIGNDESMWDSIQAEKKK